MKFKNYIYFFLFIFLIFLGFFIYYFVETFDYFKWKVLDNRCRKISEYYYFSGEKGIEKLKCFLYSDEMDLFAMDSIRSVVDFKSFPLKYQLLNREIKVVKKRMNEDYRFPYDDFLEGAYFRLCDICFRNYLPEKGLKYLDEAISYGFRIYKKRGKFPEYWYKCKSVKEVKDSLEEAICLDRGSYSSFQESLYAVNPNQELLFFPVRIFIYLEKNRDVVRKKFLEEFGGEGERLYREWIGERMSNDPEILKIVYEESRKEYWDIDVRKYFREYVDELMRKKMKKISCGNENLKILMRENGQK